jgi:hypothetical protein
MRRNENQPRDPAREESDFLKSAQPARLLRRRIPFFKTP